MIRSIHYEEEAPDKEWLFGPGRALHSVSVVCHVCLVSERVRVLRVYSAALQHVARYEI